MSLENMVKAYKGIDAKQERFITYDPGSAVKLVDIKHAYSAWLDFCLTNGLSYNANNFLQKELGNINISPSTISQFCITLKEYETHSHFTESGYFISALLQQSCDSNKDSSQFRLPLDHLSPKINFIGWGISGTPSSKLYVQINGDVGALCGAWCVDVDFTFLGKVGKLNASNSIDSTFTFNEFVGNGCGAGAKGCNLYFNGPVDMRICKAAHECDIYAKDMATLYKAKRESRASCKFYVLQKGRSKEVTSWV